jgi:RNA polymerase sigma-70 factor (ECF subfamily)
MTAHHRMLSRSGYSDAPAGGASADDKAERFRALALPHLDEVYTLARYLLREVADAEDAVQECYLRAFRHFDAFRGGPIKPWLLAILRNVCRAEYARRGRVSVLHTDAGDEAAETVSEGLWSDVPSPEAASLARLDAESAQQLIADLPEQFREVLVLREINDLSYREIADVTGVPVGTVMSRLARGRNLLRQAFAAEEK